MSRRPKKIVSKSKPRTLFGVPRGEVLDLVGGAAESVPFRALRDAFAPEGGRELAGLKRTLSGLLRSGELELDREGRYLPADAAARVEGELVGGPDGLALDVDGERYALARARRRLRPGDKVAARIVGGEARIVDVIAPSQEPLIGRLEGRGRRYWVESRDPGYRVNVQILPGRLEGARKGDVVSVCLLGEDQHGLLGRVVERIEVADPRAIPSTTYLEAYRVPTSWPEGLEAELATLPDAVDPADHSEREDLTGFPLVTIDGEDARDFDDAVFAEPRKGGWRLVVAIADVSSYVETGSALDLEALNRGNSVYLPDQVVPMLPEALSNELCSLKPDVARLAMVCDMQVAAAGRVTSYRFYPALIRSVARLTYTRVAAFIGGDASGLPAAVKSSLHALHDVYEALRARREQRGALDFDTHEVRVVLNESGVERVIPVKRNVAHMLIEEAMIAANVAAAMFIDKRGARALYRVHEGPVGEKLLGLREALVFFGVKLGSATPAPKDLKAIVDRLADRPDHWLLQMLVLRSLSQALYSPDNAGHYGLALTHYAHFTSPIRRYADLVVHRVVKQLIDVDAAPAASVPLDEVGAHISFTERRAEDVSREVIDWFKCDYASRFVGESFAGTVVAVTDFGLFVELDELYVQGLVHISNLGRDYFRHEPAHLSLVGERSGQRFAVGHRFEVVIADVDVNTRKIDLLPAGREAR